MAARVAILLLTLAASPVLAAPAPDLAVGHMRVPTRVHLTGSRATASFLATVRIENRGTTPIVFTDAATFLAALSTYVPKRWRGRSSARPSTSSRASGGSTSR
jgi:hypothetical protein